MLGDEHTKVDYTHDVSTQLWLSECSRSSSLDPPAPPNTHVISPSKHDHWKTERSRETAAVCHVLPRAHQFSPRIPHIT